MPTITVPPTVSEPANKNETDCNEKCENPENLKKKWPSCQSVVRNGVSELLGFIRW